MAIISDKAIQAKPGSRDTWLIEDGARGAGRLVGRITPAGARSFYFRYSASNGDRVRLLIGSYDPRGDGQAAFTVQQARDKARELSALYRSGVTDLREHFAQADADRLQALDLERQRVEAERRAIAEAEQAAAQDREQRLTVRQVFDRWRSTELQPRIVGDASAAGERMAATKWRHSSSATCSRWWAIGPSKTSAGRTSWPRLTQHRQPADIASRRCSTPTSDSC